MALPVVQREHEPPFDELPLRKFKRLFPEGRYTFRGETIEENDITGAARLSHDIPNGPEIISPTEGQSVGCDDVVASWSPGPQPADVEIVAYRVIFEREDPFRALSVDLPASANSVTIPFEFLEPNTNTLRAAGDRSERKYHVLGAPLFGEERVELWTSTPYSSRALVFEAV
jgi:hypothetical protein